MARIEDRPNLPRQLVERAGMAIGQKAFADVRVHGNRFVRFPIDRPEKERNGGFLDLEESHSLAAPDVPWQLCLDQFLRIYAAKDVFKFATKFGGLGFCEHRWSETPQTWAWGNQPEWTLPWHTYDDCPFRQQLSHSCREPIEAWLWSARQLRAVLRIACVLRIPEPDRTDAERLRSDDITALDLESDDPARFWLQGALQELGELHHWEHKRRPGVNGLVIGPETEPEAIWRCLQHVASRWFHQPGGVEIRLDIGPGIAEQSGKIPIVVWPGSVRGVLAQQLVAALNSSHGLFLCASCGDAFVKEHYRPVRRTPLCFTCQTDPKVRNAQARLSYRLKHPERKRTTKYDLPSPGQEKGLPPSNGVVI